MIRDDRLIERDLGELEGKKRDLYDKDKYWNYEINSNDLGVESVQSIISRCDDFLNYIKNKYDKDTTILVVTHSAPYRALKLLLNKTPLTGNLYGCNIHNTDYEEFEI